MKKTKSRLAIVRIDYEYDDERTYMGDEPEEIAIDLALNPNLHTIENGVQLIDAEFCGWNDC